MRGLWRINAFQVCWLLSHPSDRGDAVLFLRRAVCAGRDLIRCCMGKNSKDCDMSLMIQCAYLYMLNIPILNVLVAGRR